ncbi:MAG: hypothetical protein RLZ10_1481 [Bacteroidota bacterium]|jgi:asparagine synthetase B (glutamine-hydrolysing)
MTSQLFTLEEYDLANKIQRLRGPDLTNYLEFDGYNIFHNLLSVTGAFTPQPFVKNDSACMFNGQIYNSHHFGDYNSDGFCILDAYKEFGLEFPNQLDGEFAICIMDSKRNVVILATDPFGTKPLHFAVENGQIGVASYHSALLSLGFKNITKVPANTLVVISKKTYEIQLQCPLWKFDTNQYKMHYEHWILAFENSIQKRTRDIRENIFIGLSSGYDSGAIACELLKQNIEFKSYSFYNNENRDVLDSRRNLIDSVASSESVLTNKQEESSQLNYLLSKAEPGYYYIYSNRHDKVYNHSYLDDRASIGLGIICSYARKEGRKIYLSGQGSDEIMSDYGQAGEAIYDHSNFCGIFPSDLDYIFPWPSFYGSTQESYLLKDEHVAGAYSVETRYPFLDKFLVQEFLHIDHRMKNFFYKAPLKQYFEINNFPVALDVKFGFVP